ncbi:MAG: hypothetical protein HY303_14770 [Candidatus Wallbacteria bacterium]|nr:hypothetical protein [Candidatus Wallbacteria bacterium]
MKTNTTGFVLVALLVLMIGAVGCGGGGGGGGTPTPTPPSSGGGFMVKGVVTAGTVNAYLFDASKASGKGALITGASGSITTPGKFTLTLPTSAANKDIVVEVPVLGSLYVDNPATPAVTTVLPKPFLSGFHYGGENPFVANVTALNYLAYAKALSLARSSSNTNSFAANLAIANSAVAAIFNTTVDSFTTSADPTNIVTQRVDALRAAGGSASNKSFDVLDGLVQAIVGSGDDTTKEFVAGGTANLTGGNTPQTVLSNAVTTNATGGSTVPALLTVQSVTFGLPGGLAEVGRTGSTQASMTVKNLGAQNAIVRSATLAFRDAGLTGVYVSPTPLPVTVGGGATATFSFTVNASAQATLGSTGAEFGIIADGATAGSASAGSLQANALTILAGNTPDLTVTGITLSQTAPGNLVRPDGTFTASIAVLNRGGAAAVNVLGRLTSASSLPFAQQQQNTVASLAPGNTANILVTVTGTGANTPDGAYNVTARADSTDSLNNAFSGTGGAASFTVRSVAGQASLTVAANPNSGTLPSANGGPGFDSILTATVRNLGAATGSAIGNITVTPPSITGVTYSPATQTIATIAGQGSADVTFTAHFAQTASPVATPITLTASGTDADSGVAVFNESTGARTASGSATVTVNLPAAANLSIGSFSAPASARQNSSFVASYRVSNGGGTDTTINSGTLTFSVAGVSATLRQAGLGLLPAGGTITLTYDVTVSNTASFSNNPCTASATVGGSDTYARSTPGSNNALGSIDILIGPRANLSSVTETPGIPSIRKTILTPTTISFTVNNTGDGDATVSAVSLSSISGVSKSLVGNQIATVAANSTSTVQYNFTADESAALQTNTPLTLTVTFSDLGGTEPTAVLSAGTLTVAEGPLAHFVVSSTTPGTVQLDQGAQTTFTMTVTNDGDADATGLSLAVSLGSASGVTFTTDTAPSTTLTAGAATTATYRVAASNTATPGSYTISGIARGTDPRPTGVRSTTNAGAGTLSVNLVPRALFSISNASFSTGTVQVGKTFSVDVTVTNTATADGSISGATLTFDGSTALQASLASPAVPITVTNGAAGQKFTFSGTSTSAATGVQNASLSITATGPQGDVSTGRLNIGSVTVVPAPALSIVGIAFSGAPVLPNLSVGQGASIGVNVANTGTGKAFGLSGFAVVRNPFNSTVLTIGAASGPLDVAAGTTVTYSFPVTAASAGAVGITSMIFSGGYPILANTTVGDGVTVTAAPVVTVVNLTPSAQTVSRGQSAVTVLRIHNAGPGSINFSGTLSYGAATGIVAAQRGGSVNVAEGADGTATFDVLATNSAALGTDNVSVTVNGVANDTGFGVTASATNAGTLTVQLVPVVTIGTGTVTSSPVTRGNNITFTFPVSTPVNSAIADITGITVTATDTVFTADVANATTLTADSPATLTFTGAVSGSATPGNRTIGITVSYNDDNTGTAQTDATNSASGFLVQTVPTLQSANLAFTSQSGKSNRVSLGQAANVSFDVGNATGSATARITGVVSSWITNGLTLVSESSVSSLTPIAASNTKTYSASLKVPANLTPGPITATVVFQATDVNTNLTGYDITQSIPFTAQTTATNVTGAVTTLPASVAEGETGAQLLTTLTNNTPNSPAVNFNSVTWQAFRTTDSADVTNKFIFSNPSLPQVAKGSPKTVTYTFDVDISAPITSVTLRPIFAGTDEATGAAVTITPISGDLAVTGPKAVLSINSMTLSTNIVSQGQAFTAALNVSNRGA